MTPRAGESVRRCGDICECMQGWQYRNLAQQKQHDSRMGLASHGPAGFDGREIEPLWNAETTQDCFYGE